VGYQDNELSFWLFISWVIEQTSKEGFANFSEGPVVVGAGARIGVQAADMKFLLKKCLRKKAPEMKPGAILDAVISQSSATACKCLLYKLADYKRGKEFGDPDLLIVISDPNMTHPEL